MANSESGSGRLRFWSGALWFVTIFTGFGAFGCAFYGWTLDREPQGVWDWIEVGARSFHAFFLSDFYFDEVKEQAQIPIALARTLAIAFTLLVAGRIVIAALGAWFARRMLRGRSGHDVVVGDGPAAREYARLGLTRKVTLVDDDLPDELGQVATLRRRRPFSEQLKAANAKRARRILVDEGDDAATWHTAQEAARTCKGAEILAFVRDPWLQERLSRVDADSNLTPFSYASGVARQVMLAHPPYLAARRLNAPAQHILVIGFGQVGQALIREFLSTSIHPDPGGLMVTAIDPNMLTLKEDFAARHPALNTQADIHYLTGDIRLEDGALLSVLRERCASAEFCAVYVAVQDSALPMSLAVAVKDKAERLNLFRAPIFVCAEHGSGLPRVRQGPGLVGEPCQTPEERSELEARSQSENCLFDLRLVSFGAWRSALDGSGLMEPDLDRHARKLHEAYRRNTGALEPGAVLRPSQQPWEKLSDEYRVANRRAAAHIRAKAAAAGFDLAGWLAAERDGRLAHELPPAAGVFNLTDDDLVDRLSRLEHRRWIVDRLLNGWRRGEPRDDRARIHPDLKPFEELDAMTVAKDAAVVETTREILAQEERDGR
ncbi:MAG: RyR domain-containing protein [Hyphomonadaceae bacterium]